MRTPPLIRALPLLALALVSCHQDSGSTPNLGPRVRSTAALQQFSSCDDLLARLKANYSEELRATLLSRRGHGPMFLWNEDSGAAAPGATATAGGTGAAPRTEGTSYSGTNNQEAGVDEADFVKTDGYRIYVLDGRKLTVLGVPEIGGLDKQGSIELEGWPTQMLLSGDRVVVYSNVYTWDLPETDPLAPFLGRKQITNWGIWWRVSSLVKMTVIDVSDPAAPKIAREAYLEGWYETARRIDSTVRMVSYSMIEVPGVYAWPQIPADAWSPNLSLAQWQQIIEKAVLDTIASNDAAIAAASLADFVPLLLVREPGGALTRHDFTSQGCANFTIAKDGMSHGFTSILTLDMLGASFGYESDHIVSNWSSVYSSTDAMIIAEPAQDWWWFWDNDAFDEATNLHRFDVSQAGITTYSGSGRIEGLIRDQFSLSEAKGIVRAASTTGQWWRWWVSEQPDPENHVWTLAAGQPTQEGLPVLDVVGHLGGIAKGERLFTSRFVGDQAFLVSAKYVDPLFTIDLSDPANPQLMGELEVAGVSTYIHPLADAHLLTIGYAGSDQNRIAWGTTQVSLFDVSNFSQPALDAALTLSPPAASDGWQYSYSQATWDHLAFDYWAPLSMLAVPMTTWRYVSGRCPAPNAQYWCSSYQYFSGLELVKVDVTGGKLAVYGTLDHSDFYNAQGQTWWYSTDISRSIFMHDDVKGDFVYAVSNRGVTVHSVQDGLPKVASVELDGTPNYWGY